MKYLELVKPGEYMDEYLQEFLQEGFIKPMEEMGAEFEGYGHMTHEESCTGVHVLFFTGYEGSYFRLDRIMSADDGQPKSGFTRFWDNVWITIPYSG